MTQATLEARIIPFIEKGIESLVFYLVPFHNSPLFFSVASLDMSSPGKTFASSFLILFM